MISTDIWIFIERLVSLIPRNALHANCKRGATYIHDMALLQARLSLTLVFRGETAEMTRLIYSTEATECYTVF